MSQPPDVELEQLRMIAADLQEVVAERGYRVDVALDADPAQRSGTGMVVTVADGVMTSASDETVSLQECT